MPSSLPIGVFDSGLGGLTVLKTLKEFLPNEQFIYYGDTAHLPYGEKSEEALVSYVSSIAGFLKSKQCKLMVVACNSASTVLDKVKDMPFSSEEVVNVIDPVVETMIKQERFHAIGIIGTRKTINSGLFQSKISEGNPKLSVNAKMTPLLVPMIEEGFMKEEELFPVFERYFKDFSDIDLLIPACTHYPMIYPQIERFFDHKVKVLNTPKIVAERVQRILHDKDQFSFETVKLKDEYHLSDLTESFQREAEMFLGQPIHLVKTLLK